MDEEHQEQNDAGDETQSEERLEAERLEAECAAKRKSLIESVKSVRQRIANLIGSRDDRKTESDNPETNERTESHE